MINRQLQPQEIQDWQILWSYYDKEEAKKVRPGTTTGDMVIALGEHDYWEKKPVPQDVLRAIDLGGAEKQIVIKWGHIAREIKNTTLDTPSATNGSNRGSDVGGPKIWIDLYNRNMTWTTIIIERALTNLYGENIMGHIFKEFCKALGYGGSSEQRHSRTLSTVPPAPQASSSSSAAAGPSGGNGSNAQPHEAHPEMKEPDQRDSESESETEAEEESGSGSEASDDSDYDTESEDESEEESGAGAHDSKGPQGQQQSEGKSYRQSVFSTLKNFKSRITKKDQR